MPPVNTPMMQQYLRIKELHPDCILFFRLGDFYEMFNEDAKLASRELELTLTSRDRGKPENLPQIDGITHRGQFTNVFPTTPPMPISPG